MNDAQRMKNLRKRRTAAGLKEHRLWIKKEMGEFKHSDLNRHKILAPNNGRYY